MARIRTRVRKTLIARGSDARFVPTGHLVYVSAGTLLAVPFDLSTLEVTGEAVPVVEGVSRGSPGGSSGTSFSAHFTFSNTGSLAYVPGPASAGQQELALFDRKGEGDALKLPPGTYQTPRVAPNGRQIVFGTTDGIEAAIWIYELSGESAVRRLTFGGNNRLPIWPGDGRRVAFQSDRDGDPAVLAAYRRRHRRAPDEARSGHIARSGVLVSRRRSAAVQRDEGFGFVALDVLAQGSESDALQRRDRFSASHQCDVLTRRPLGRVPSRRNGLD